MKLKRKTWEHWNKEDGGVNSALTARAEVGTKTLEEIFFF